MNMSHVKCTPCREGTGWLRRIVERIETGEGRDDDIELLTYIITNNIKGKAFCPLAEGAVANVESMVKHFKNDFRNQDQLGEDQDHDTDAGRDR